MKSYQEQPRSSSSCAACKFLKRRCTSNCQFAPYFRSDEPKKFAKVHKVFGASNVSKILNEVAEDQREDTVDSLVYEAEVRLRDPVYGCIGAIASLQHRMVELQRDLILARARLASYVGHCSLSSFLDDHGGLFMAPNFLDIPESNSLPFDQFGRFHFP
ncbi:LOB domain-containing protein 21 [Sesamum alatum]|uniref:LOB domain-containing protein 21 n=1 Tax=Sesamum alatum TaxID=300844 RepID=A0AAE2CVU1_9LAMI|nr:LOB domain-containing protein 21 [Sesamum alatum]